MLEKYLHSVDKFVGLVSIILSYFWHECFLRRFSSATLVYIIFSVSCSAIDEQMNLMDDYLEESFKKTHELEGDAGWISLTNRILNWINSLSRTESTYESLSEPLAFRPIFYLFSYFTLMSLFYVAFPQCCGEFDS